MRVLDVPDLGYGGAVITVQGERILMLSTDLSQDERVGYMLGAMVALDGSA